VETEPNVGRGMRVCNIDGRLDVMQAGRSTLHFFFAVQLQVFILHRLLCRCMCLASVKVLQT
jgi:hypothetical protein